MAKKKARKKRSSENHARRKARIARQKSPHLEVRARLMEVNEQGKLVPTRRMGAIQRFTAGETPSAIAGDFGVTVATIQQWIRDAKEAGIRPRTYSEASIMMWQQRSVSDRATIGKKISDAKKPARPRDSESALIQRGLAEKTAAGHIILTRKGQAVSRYQQGESIGSIVKDIKSSHKTVTGWLDEENIVRRSRAESNKLRWKAVPETTRKRVGKNLVASRKTRIPETIDTNNPHPLIRRGVATYNQKGELVLTRKGKALVRYHRGESKFGLCADLKVSIQTFNIWLKEEKVRERTRAESLRLVWGKKSEKEVRELQLRARVAQRYKRGFSLSEISSIVGVSRETVKRLLLSARVQIRSRSETQKLRNKRKPKVPYEQRMRQTAHLRDYWAQLTIEERKNLTKPATEAARIAKTKDKRELEYVTKLPICHSMTHAENEHFVKIYGPTIEKMLESYRGQREEVYDDLRQEGYAALFNVLPRWDGERDLDTLVKDAVSFAFLTYFSKKAAHRREVQSDGIEYKVGRGF